MMQLQQYRKIFMDQWRQQIGLNGLNISSEHVLEQRRYRQEDSLAKTEIAHSIEITLNQIQPINEDHLLTTLCHNVTEDFREVISQGKTAFTRHIEIRKIIFRMSRAI